MMPRVALSLAALVATGICTPAQAPSPHPLAGLVVSSVRFGSIDEVRQLSDGRVFVNDGIELRLLMLDATLDHQTVVMDSAVRGAARAYGRAPGVILPYAGDTTLFIEAPLTFLLIDPAGDIRAVAPPRVQDLSGMTSARAGFDHKTGMVYQLQLLRPGPGVTSPGMIDRSAQPDSVLIVRGDLVTRAIDTIAYVLTPRFFPGHAVNPVPLADDWVMTSDGTLAIVRAHDFHLDWISADGQVTASRAMPYPWRRLSDSDKVVIVDSLRRYLDLNPSLVSSAALPRPGGSGRAGGAGQSSLAVGPDPTELPDYGMPFVPGLTCADADGNVWIARVDPMPAQASMEDILMRAGRGRDLGPHTYDVVSRAGTVVDRVTIPGGSSIVGFGPGVVYLASREPDGVALTRGRIH